MGGWDFVFFFRGMRMRMRHTLGSDGRRVADRASEYAFIFTALGMVECVHISMMTMRLATYLD